MRLHACCRFFFWLLAREKRFFAWPGTVSYCHGSAAALWANPIALYSQSCCLTLLAWQGRRSHRAFDRSKHRPALIPMTLPRILGMVKRHLPIRMVQADTSLRPLQPHLLGPPSSLSPLLRTVRQRSTSSLITLA